MNKKVILIGFLLAVLLLVSGAGCGGTTTVVEDRAFIGGTDGLDISFSDEMEEFYYAGSNSFDIPIFLINMGESDSNKIFVSLSGINQESFGLTQMDKEAMRGIEGRDVAEPGFSDEVDVEFKNALFKPELKHDFKPTIKADVCYLYGTEAFANVCLKKDVYSRDEEDSCEVASVLSSEVSSAPIQVSEIKARPSGNGEIKFSFVIENKGNGKVYSNTAFDGKCRGSGRPGADNKVLVKVDTRNIKTPIDCSAFGENSKQAEVSLIKGKRTINCKINTLEAEDISFEERFNINLYYFYKESITKEIVIKP